MTVYCGLFIFDSIILIKNDPCNSHYRLTHSYNTRHEHDFAKIKEKILETIKQEQNYFILKRNLKRFLLNLALNIGVSIVYTRVIF